jgi:hypothetical protein
MAIRTGDWRERGSQVEDFNADWRDEIATGRAADGALDEDRPGPGDL